jgi:hypothetical protein
MKISEPIFIEKTENMVYEITGTIPGYGTVRRYGRSEEEAKERFFEACNKVGKGTLMLESRDEQRPKVDLSVYEGSLPGILPGRATGKDFFSERSL